VEKARTFAAKPASNERKNKPLTLAEKGEMIVQGWIIWSSLSVSV